MTDDRAPRSARRLARWHDVQPLLGWGTGPRGRASRLLGALTIDDLRTLAKRRTPRSVFDYVDGAAESELTLARNRAEFEAVEFVPRMLRDVRSVDLSTTILGERSALPIAIAPTGFNRMVHHLGESAVAWAANRAGIPYSLATLGTVEPEEIARLTPSVPRWFQLYLNKDRGKARALVERVRESGYSALIVTVDTAVVGSKRRDIRSGLTIPPKITPRSFGNMAIHPRWWMNALTTPPLGFESLRDGSGGSLFELLDSISVQGVDRDAIAWLRSIWPGTLVVKGVLSPDDGRAAVALGADALIISNHGGRQLDRAVTPFGIVSEFRERLGRDVELIVDSGIRTGGDVVAAIAAGADSCMVGRAYLYGLMAGGAAGVVRSLDILEGELRHAFRLLGLASVDEIGPDLIRERARRRA